MSGSRTKRQFAGAASDPSQRSITSFFMRTSSSTTAADVASKTASHGALSGPVIPPQVQTDLLNVGMRVRKAIPEGYKTGSAYSAFTLWDESTGDPVKPQPTATTSSAAFTSTIRELEPFCGLNKVGGLAFQPAYHPNSRSVTTTSVADDDDLNAMPGLTSSQDTIASTTSFVPTATTGYGTINITTTNSTTASLPPRKRFYTSDEEEAAHNAQITTLPYRGPVRLSSDSQEAWLLDEEISPRSLAPPPGLWENARVLAVPRRSKQNQQTGRKSPGAVGQENVMVVVRDSGQDGNDFEEATFLDYGLTGTGDVRMEME
ncbi:ribonucleotide reductase inhibitor-domain-containing protein [Corynascus novoguineensis]|uniref:Ribonucleotide reductase inhibitor-domain-containing protein n=1 Tax=Corynascus novoguineensis TaxID=1126955 RepID=A0AAN7HI51_9PEZI|nr:ribonucleotide reductase inhibitor-domain-containing protein [Corynascus novoguineensis]